MDINFKIEISELSDEEKLTIKNCLEVTTDQDFKKAMNKIAKASFSEYKKMFLERGVPTKADEVLQEKLFYLIKYYFVDILPNESTISNIFQLTSSASKTLLKNTISRYRIQLEGQLKQTISKVISQKEKSGEKYRMIIQSENIKDQINLFINQKQPRLKKLTAVKNSAGEFECPEDTYNFLEEEFPNGN